MQQNCPFDKSVVYLPKLQTPKHSNCLYLARGSFPAAVLRGADENRKYYIPRQVGKVKHLLGTLPLYLRFPIRRIRLYFHNFRVQRSLYKSP